MQKLDPMHVEVSTYVPHTAAKYRPEEVEEGIKSEPLYLGDDGGAGYENSIGYPGVFELAASQPPPCELNQATKSVIAIR